jgi:hypothetical protein
VDESVVVSAEEHEVVERRLAAMCPVADVVGVDEAVVLAAGRVAAREGSPASCAQAELFAVSLADRDD